jgi:predicted transcriptional regulator
MRNRERDEIIRDILLTAGENTSGVNASRIMSHAGLTSAQCHAYLNDLVEKGLIDNGGKTALGRSNYKTTPKGIEYLSALNKMAEILTFGSISRNEI